MNKTKFLKILLHKTITRTTFWQRKPKVILLAILILATLSLPFSVFAQVDTGFNPNKLIEDKIFVDIETFGGPEGIQRFLEIKGSVLANTSADFLVKLKEPEAIILKQGLEDPRPNLGRLRTAAELIWDASRQSGLNPQVILVTLQKEQGLITNHQNSTPEKLQKALDRAMGFDCPDSGGCGNLFPGFYYQLFGNFDSANNRYLGATKSLMKSYSYENGRGPAYNGGASRVGDVIILDNTQGSPYNAPAQSQITLLNRATAALYRYTPHVFNGNYNFWKFFQEWFRYPNGTVLALLNDTKTYIIQNGARLLLPEFVARARGLSTASKLTVSPNELDSYPYDAVYGPADNTIVTAADTGKQYVFLANKPHPASDFVIRQRNLNVANKLEVAPSELALFEIGQVLTPNNGTIIKGQTDTAIYLVDGGNLKLFSEYVYKQRKVNGRQLISVPDEEIATYPKLGYVPPLDGTLVKSTQDSTVYLIEQGFKKPISAELFKNRAFSFKKVVTLSSGEVAGLTIGAYAAPKDKTWFAVGSKTGPLYYFKEGSKHSISSFVAKQRGITPDYIFSESEAITWFDGIPLPPRDGTIVKGKENPTVYLVSKSQLRPLTEKAFKARRIKANQISILPQAEVDAYAKGEVLVK